MFCQGIHVFLVIFATLTEGSWGCTSGFMNRDLLVRRASKISLGGNGLSPNVLSSRQFLVIPGMNFTCDGTITSLLLGVDVRTRRTDHLRIDLWRPDNNMFQHVSGSHRRIMLAAGDFSPDGVLRYNLKTSLNFQIGDVLGVYQPRHSNSIVRLFYTMQLTPPVGYIILNHLYNQVSHVSTSGHKLFNGYLLLRPITSNDSCLSGFLSVSELKQQTLAVNINSVRRRDRQQRLFPDIHFTCNGSITKWIVGAEMRAGGTEQPELQIWRRDSGEGNSCTKINSSLLTPNETSDPNVHEYYPDTPLEFQEGDILGVYQPRFSDSQLVVYYQVNTGPDNYRQRNVYPPAPSTFTLRNPINQKDYPLVTVKISTDLPTSVIPEFTPTTLAEPSIISSATSLHEVPMTPAVMTPGTSSSQPILDDLSTSVIPEFTPTTLAEPSIISSATSTSSHEVPMTPAVMTPGTGSSQPLSDGFVPCKTMTISTSSSTLLSTSLHDTSPSPSSTGEGGRGGEGGGISSATIAARVVVVLVLFIIITVIVIMMAIFTWRKKNNTDQALASYSAKEMELQQNACYAASSKIRIESETYPYTPVEEEHTDPPIDVDHNIAYSMQVKLQDNPCYTAHSCTENEPWSETYSYIPVDTKHTYPPIHVDQNVAYYKRMDMQENVCYSASYRPDSYAYVQVDTTCTGVSTDNGRYM